jgi:cobalt-precorrin 5A hydrolase
VIVAGIGCRKGVGAPAVLAAVAAALDHYRVARLDALAAPDFKRRESGLLVAAQRLGLELRLVGAEALEAVGHLTMSRSARVLAVAGVPSASEAAALAACGASARLVGPRLIVGDVTCAVASNEILPDESHP